MSLNSIFVGDKGMFLTPIN